MEMSRSSQMRISSSCPEFKLTSTLLYVQVDYFRVALCWRNAGWKRLPTAQLYGEYELVRLIDLIPSLASRHC